ncbi:hypothetical protein AZI86_09205 [Bdellovibrio bacteriovorus]|uniref:Methyltransferase domain-containing protein n=1 Tax=Bdellovibrio bacteriovorus TaxID=959 RepID=A0A150WS17_BDEBC|nr:class I SAM-dependent methyltransferase [Bdellovibrio bacteriovorus]KYG67176.1 hypothetical protein AZI86_09205 [Bdellovibrio bacteriovorus]
MSDSTWAAYNTGEYPARPRLLTTLDNYCKESGMALDLGCGSGRDTKELLKRGWAVTAVDSDLGSLKTLQAEAPKNNKLTVLNTNFESLQLSTNTFNLINASYALPFCRPQSFLNFWQMMVASLRPNGIVSFELFGINDDWAKLPRPASTMSFHSRTQVDHLLKDLKIEIFKEEEFEGPTFDAPDKHWHIFSCIVRKDV